MVETRDGRRARFVVQAVDDQAIVAPGDVRYERADISRLQHRSFSGPKTILLVGGVFGAAFVLFAAAAAAALGEWE